MLDESWVAYQNTKPIELGKDCDVELRVQHSANHIKNWVVRHNLITGINLSVRVLAGESMMISPTSE